MKKLILFLITVYMCIGLNAQNSAYGKTIHQDYGTFRVSDDNGNVVSFSGFVTIEKVDPLTHRDDVQYQSMKMQKNAKLKIEPETMYHYEMYLVSKSVFEGDTTSTWLYGVRVFINGEDVLINQFPDGFIVSIKTTPTSIHTYDSNSQNVKFELKWKKAIYEPRIRK